MGWFDDTLRGAVAFATGGISEAAIGVEQAITTGDVNKLGGAVITGVTGPIGALTGAAVAVTGGYAGVTGDSSALNAVKSVRDQYTGTIKGGLEVAGALIGAGAAAGQTKNPLAKLFGSKTDAKTPAGTTSPVDDFNSPEAIARRRAAMAAEDAKARQENGIPAGMRAVTRADGTVQLEEIPRMSRKKKAAFALGGVGLLGGLIALLS